MRSQQGHTLQISSPPNSANLSEVSSGDCREHPLLYTIVPFQAERDVLWQPGLRKRSKSLGVECGKYAHRADESQMRHCGICRQAESATISHHTHISWGERPLKPPLLLPPCPLIKLPLQFHPLQIRPLSVRQWFLSLRRID